MDIRGRLTAIKALAKVTDSVTVSFSGGKDSLVTLDLCTKFIPKVTAVFFYKIPNLQFENAYFSKIKKIYGVDVVKFPSPSLLNFLKEGAYGSDTVKGVKALPDLGWWQCIKERFQINSVIRQMTGAAWVAVGVKKYDTVLRYTSIYKRYGNMNLRDRVSYPVIDWKDKDIWNYIRRNNLPTNPLYARCGRSFGMLVPKTVTAIREMFPEDYARIKALYPHVGVIEERGKMVEVVKAAHMEEVRSRRVKT